MNVKRITASILSFLVSMIFIFFAIFHREKGKQSIEEVLKSTNRMIDSILGAWGIRS